ncbi:MAG TPA: hypothetical protein VK483_03670, partial [Chitinophagaceae bacterium]|nr:hypothetical protein [Chitinophagaceae bacterium]
MKKHLIYWLAAISIMMVGCQKELSFEGSNTPAEGSLQSDVTGDCLPKTVNGTYVTGTALVPATNTITVQVNVVKTGIYVVTTDTVNGYYFRAASTFTTLGATTVTLRGNGTPFAAGVNNFVVSFDSTFCDIQVTVIAPLPPGVGSLAGSPNACAPITVNGGYSPGVALTSGNNVVVQVNVTTAGNFNITTDTVAGMWFTFTGGLALSPPPQNVTLQAQGSIPAATTPGVKTFKVKLGTSQCTFDVTIAGPAVYTIDCPNVTVNGTYQVGVPLNPAFHIITIPVTVVTPGPYSITLMGFGMTFTGSGTLTGVSGSITLTGLNSTSPAAPAGVKTLTLGTCSIPITVVAAPVINWKFNVGAIVYQGSSSTVPGDIDYDNTTFPPFTFFFYVGTNAVGDDFEFNLLDQSGGVTATETYNSDAAPFSQ